MGRKAKGASLTVAKDSSGTYVRNLGYLADGRQPRFYFGKDQTEALIRSVRLGATWDRIEAAWQQERKTPRPCWYATTLEIGKAVARGAKVFTIDTEGNGTTLAHYRLLFAGIDGFPLLDLPGAQATLDKEAEKLEKKAKVLRGANAGQTLHAAFDAFAVAQREKYTVDGNLSPHGVLALRQIDLLKDHIEDLPLDSFDCEAIDRLADYWSKRPVSKRGKPMSPHTVKCEWMRFEMFVKWLHKSKAFAWRKPEDYEPRGLKVKLSQAERAAIVAEDGGVKTYTIDELALLYTYSNPRERLFMLLALNCGFGAGELYTLQTLEVNLAKVGARNGLSNFIRRLRNKTPVPGEWRLWDVTAEGLRWYLSQRPETSAGELFVSPEGKPFGGQTKGGNHKQLIPNQWGYTTAQIRKEHPSFRALSFNKLRKTAHKAIKEIAGGEVAGIFLSHGQPVATDKLADAYSNRDFGKVHAAIAKWGEQLAGVFAAVSSPWTAREGNRMWFRGAKLRAELLTLKGEGLTIAQSAERLGITFNKARWHLETARKGRKQ